MWVFELAIASTFRAKFEEKVAGRVEDLDAMVTMISYEHPIYIVNDYTMGMFELAIAST